MEDAYRTVDGRPLGAPLFLAGDAALVVGGAVTISLRVPRDIAMYGWNVRCPDPLARLTTVEVSAEALVQTLQGVGCQADEPNVDLPMAFHGLRVPLTLRQGTQLDFIFAAGTIAANTVVSVQVEAYRLLVADVSPAPAIAR